MGTSFSKGVTLVESARNGIGRVANRVGAPQRVSRRLSDARAYWANRSEPRWLSDSHWRGGIDDDVWAEVGRDHLAIYEVFARALGRPARPGVVVEWGCGGGANAVAFAPIAEKFIAADVSSDSVVECIAQIGAVCDTPTEALIVDIAHPERAVVGREESCDTFICLYVLETTASVEEALRIVRIAERLLVKGGMAVFQVKYRTSAWRTRGHRRNYRRNLANMTTFGIDEFWLRAGECNLTPRLITLVPENRLDLRYAYFALTKT